MFLFLQIGTSCQHDDFNSAQNEETGTYTINYTIDSAETRGIAAESKEKIINDVCILFYHINDDTFAAYTVAQVTTGSGSFSISIPQNLQTGSQYKVLILGNYN